MMSINEKILNDCFDLYADPHCGLVKIASQVGIKLKLPHRKVNILLIGNHSAGKSSFINWYIDDPILKTGVAMTTQEFTLVTKGNMRESLSGSATLKLFPEISGLKHIKDAVDYVVTEISPSKSKQFSSIAFIDTPGLVDSDMKYPFDITETVLCLGEIVDLIFVFFDPVGLALCKRTLNLADRLNESHANKIHLLLAKADESGSEVDRQKVLMQIVQEIVKRPGLNKAGLDLHTIFIPSLQEKKTTCVNQIEDAVCKEIDKAIKYTVQNTLNRLEKDADLVINAVQVKLKEDNEIKAKNFSRKLKSALFLLIALLIAVCVVISVIPNEFFENYAGKKLTSEINNSLVEPFNEISSFLPEEYQSHYILIASIFAFILIVLSRIVNSSKSALTKQESKRLQEFLQNDLKNKKTQLYDEYLQKANDDFQNVKN